jgi:hypothetical protein
MHEGENLGAKIGRLARACGGGDGLVGGSGRSSLRQRGCRSESRGARERRENEVSHRPPLVLFGGLNR